MLADAALRSLKVPEDPFTERTTTAEAAHSLSGISPLTLDAGGDILVVKNATCPAYFTCRLQSDVHFVHQGSLFKKVELHNGWRLNTYLLQTLA